MAKVKYRYNPDSLSYDKIRKPFWARFLILLSYFSVILAVALVLNVAYGSLFDTPKEKKLKRENEVLNSMATTKVPQTDTKFTSIHIDPKFTTTGFKYHITLYLLFIH